MTSAPSPGNAVFELTYFVRLGVGSQQGDGINRATAVFPGARGTPIRSNTALFKVNVQGGVFSNEGCIVGKVYMDCDGNSAQGNDGGSRELGIPGVRLVMLDGSFIVTDNEGKYSLCGVKPQTHVIKVDRTTLPRGARLMPSSNRNAGVGDSIFVEMKGGELPGPTSSKALAAPKCWSRSRRRRAEGGVNLPQPDRQLQPAHARCALGRSDCDEKPLKPRHCRAAHGAPRAGRGGGARVAAWHRGCPARRLRPTPPAPTCPKRAACSRPAARKALARARSPRSWSACRRRWTRLRSRWPATTCWPTASGD
jgi:hypothetical protein